MKKTHRILSLLLTLVMCLGLSVPAMAASGNYEVVNTASDGLSAAKRDGKWGFIDATGREVIPCKYLLVSDFHNGVAVVNDGVHDAVINKAGQEIVTAGKYDCIWYFSGDFALVSQGGKQGYIDTAGREVIPCQFEYAGNFSEGLAPVMVNGKCGYINTTGKVVIPCQYDIAAGFSGGAARVSLDHKWGIIDKTGKVVVVIGKFDLTNDVPPVLTTPTTPTVPDVPEPHVGAFTDVATSAFYAQPVLWAVEKDITAGTSATTFSPNTTCTQGQILTFLWRAKGEPAPTGTVSGTAFYAKAAQWAAEQGLTDDFDANAPCTRAMVVTYLWKLAGSPAASGSQFTDVPDGASYAQAVAWAVAQGITSGTSTTTFSPDTTCTRGQIVTFLYRAYQ